MRDKKSGNMNHVSANNEYHIPLHVKPVQSKKGRCNKYKSNNNSEVIQIGDLLLHV